MNPQSVTILDVSRIAWRYKFLAFGLFLVFLAPVVLYAFVAPPVYRATLVMAPASMGSQGSGLGATLGQLGGLVGVAGLPGSIGRGAEVEEALAVMHSRAFTSDFLADMKAEGDIARHLEIPAGQLTQGLGRAKVARYFDSSMRSVSQDKKTGLYQLSVEWSDPVAAALWANETVTRLNAVMRARAIERSQASQGYLQEAAAGANQVDVRNAMNRLLESEIRQLTMARVTPEFAFRVVDPATTPETDEKVRPKRRSLIVAGALFAALASLLIVVSIGALRAKP